MMGGLPPENDAFKAIISVLVFLLPLNPDYIRPLEVVYYDLTTLLYHLGGPSKHL